MKISRKFRWLAGIIFALLFLCFIVPALLPHGPISWYANNPRYTLWRLGLYPYNDRVIYQGLVGDVWADDVVRGKTLPELRVAFHNIHEISEFDSYALAKVSSVTNSTCTFVKWGDHDFFIEIKNGRASSIHLWKG
jgi:hypothetical protein